MKRIAALLVVLLGTVCFSAATTLTLNDGEGKMSSLATLPAYYHFLFFGPNAAIQIQTGPSGLSGGASRTPGERSRHRRPDSADFGR